MNRKNLGERNFLFISVWIFKSAKLENYVCTSCGYTESYVFEDVAKN